MVIAVEHVLPLDTHVSVEEQVTRLRRLKNSLIGHRKRKNEVLPLDHLKSLVSIVHEYPRSPGPLAEWELCTLAADILGIVSNFNPSSAAAFPLLIAEAPQTLLLKCSNLIRGANSEPLEPHVRYKILQGLLRSTRIVWTQHASNMLPRTWGADVFDTYVMRHESLNMAACPEMESMMQAALSASGYPTLDAWVASTFRFLVTTLSDGSGLASGSSPPEPGNLLQLLQSCADLPRSSKSHWGTVSSTVRLNIAEDICLLLARTLRDPENCRLLLKPSGSVTGDADSIFSLYKLAQHGGRQVQKAAILALVAIFRHANHSLNAMPEVSLALNVTETDCAKLITEWLQSGDPALRLAAADCAIVIAKNRQIGDKLLCTQQMSALVPMLSSMLNSQSDPHHTATAAKTLTYLIVDQTELQESFIKLKGLFTLRDLLMSMCVKTSNGNETRRDAIASVDTAVIEGGLLLAACLCTTQSDNFKQQILGADLLPLIVYFLHSRAPSIKAAACHCIRGLGRSVNVLRTSLADSKAAEPLSNLLKPEEDLVVQITAAAAVSNLLLEFSPIRASLIAAGCIPHLCLQAQSGDHDLKLNALWALKNACYQSPSSFKREMMSHLGWNLLAELIGGPDSAVAEQGLGILRNITCTYGNDPFTGLGPSEMGEQRMLWLLTRRCQGEPALALQALYTVANLATSSEAVKLAIAAETDLMIHIVSRLESSNADIRCAALWCIINLVYFDRTSLVGGGVAGGGRRPREVVDKLRALKVEDQLRLMTNDPDLDVRERVRDALNVFGQLYAPVMMA